MMNENDLGSEKVLRAINHLYMMQECICIAALKELRSAELTDKNILLRTIMRDMPDCGICADLPAEEYGVDFWADRAAYVIESTIYLYVTQAEENVLWNIEKKGQKPGRLAVPQQRITVRGDGMGTAPVIPLAYLTVLSAKLVAMAFPNEQTAAELSDYDDERVMILLGERLQTILEDLAGMPDGDDGASPVSCAAPGKNGAAPKDRPAAEKLASLLFDRFFFNLFRLFPPDGLFFHLQFAFEQLVHQFAFGLLGLERCGRNVRNIHFQIIQITLIRNAEDVASEPLPDPFVAFGLVFGLVIHPV